MPVPTTESEQRDRGRRIVITTVGSLGDLYPYLAIAHELQSRGHQVVFATSPCYERMIESRGLCFHAVRPDSAWLKDPEQVRRLSHPRWGLLRVGREWLMPAIRESYEDMLAATEGADLLVSMVATYASRLVAEKTGIPWASAVHIPLAFFSAHDPPVLDCCPTLSRRLRFAGPVLWGPAFWAGKRISRFLAGPWYSLRAELGLPATNEGNPLADSHSPQLVLALFSRLLADKQPDWPAQTLLTGYPFLDSRHPSPLPADLQTFLDEGPPPIVFTLGSAVSRDPGSFFQQSAECAELLGRRAVMIVGNGNLDRFPCSAKDVKVVEYAPFSELFPQAAAVVHHGGVGTTGLAMRAGRPMLVVPYAWDQPDHADRITRMGIGRTLWPARYTAARAAKELGHLLDDPTYATRAGAVGSAVAAERGVTDACDALEQLR